MVRVYIHVSVSVQKKCDNCEKCDTTYSKNAFRDRECDTAVIHCDTKRY
jgi:hypothetical protein